MKLDLAKAVAQALARVRAGTPKEAARVIQDAMMARAPDRAHEQSVDAAEAAPAPEQPPVAPFPHRVRSPLRDVVEALQQGLPGASASGSNFPGFNGPAPMPVVAAGALYEWRTISAEAGAREFRLYVPASVAAGAAARGILVMLHGCTQTPDDFAAGAVMNEHAERSGLVVAYPAQTRAHNAQGCWNWFRPSDQQRDVGEPAILAAMTAALMREFGVNRSNVFVAGLSAGGAMAAIMAERYPDLFSAVGVHSGLPVGSATDVVTAFAAMRGSATPDASSRLRSAPRAIIFHGSADATVHPSNAERIAAAIRDRLDGAATRAHHGVTPGGRRFACTITSLEKTPAVECWMIDGLGHAWSGGSPRGSYTDPTGPDASGEMVRFFLAPT